MDPTLAIELIIKIIANLGFPIFVAVYLLIYQNRVIKDLQTAIESLTIAIEKMSSKDEG